MNNIEYYNVNADEFYDKTVNADMSYWHKRFLKYIPDGGRILDAGCGSGRDSKAFIGQGYSVVAIDASREMCKRAANLLGQEVWQMRFDEMSFKDEFDGVWACASLLHVSENEIDDAIQRIKMSLSDNGILYASFKYGDGTTEKHERSFLNYTEETIQEMMERAGFEILECESTTDVRLGREDERWVSIIGRII